MSCNKRNKTKTHLLLARLADRSSPCVFCQRDTDDEVTYGKLYAIGNIHCHYFCVLLSCCVIQNGKDNEGLFGFLYPDIITEVERSKKHKCSYCGRVGATLGCNVTKCRKQFHLPCGRERRAVSLFFGNYKTFCEKHAPVQKVNKEIMEKVAPRLRQRKQQHLNRRNVMATVDGMISCDGDEVESFKDEQYREKDTVCVICYETVEGYPTLTTFWPPCCARDAWFHRNCLQRMAISAGVHYLKCPLCNEKEVFYKAVLSQGYYVPDRDAAWELEQNAFSEIYERSVECGAPDCACPDGRDYDADDGSWSIKLCLLCGSAGIHAECLATGNTESTGNTGNTGSGRYVCATCLPVAPDNIDSLAETVKTVVMQNEAQPAPELRRRVMPCRMSLRRTKQRIAASLSSSSSHAYNGQEEDQDQSSDVISSRHELNLKTPRIPPLIEPEVLKNVENKLLSPLKMLEQGLHERLSDARMEIELDSEQLIGELRKRLKKPKPLFVKKKIVNDILENVVRNLYKEKIKSKVPIKEWISPKKCPETEMDALEINENGNPVQNRKVETEGDIKEVENHTILDLESDHSCVRREVEDHTMLELESDHGSVKRGEEDDTILELVSEQESAKRREEDDTLLELESEHDSTKRGEEEEDIIFELESEQDSAKRGEEDDIIFELESEHDSAKREEEDDIIFELESEHDSAKRGEEDDIIFELESEHDSAKREEDDDTILELDSEHDSAKRGEEDDIILELESEHDSDKRGEDDDRILELDSEHDSAKIGEEDDTILELESEHDSDKRGEEDDTILELYSEHDSAQREEEDDIILELESEHDSAQRGEEDDIILELESEHDSAQRGEEDDIILELESEHDSAKIGEEDDIMLELESEHDSAKREDDDTILELESEHDSAKREDDDTILELESEHDSAKRGEDDTVLELESEHDSAKRGEEDDTVLELESEHDSVMKDKCAIKFSAMNKGVLQCNKLDIDMESFKHQYLNEVDRDYNSTNNHNNGNDDDDYTTEPHKWKTAEKLKLPEEGTKAKRKRKQNKRLMKYKKESEIEVECERSDHMEVKNSVKFRHTPRKDFQVKIKWRWNERLKLKITEEPGEQRGKRMKRELRETKSLKRSQDRTSILKRKRGEPETTKRQSKKREVKEKEKRLSKLKKRVLRKSKMEESESRQKLLKQYVFKYSESRRSKALIEKPEHEVTPFKRKYSKRGKLSDGLVQTSLYNFFQSKPEV